MGEALNCCVCHDVCVCASLISPLSKLLEARVVGT